MCEVLPRVNASLFNGAASILNQLLWTILSVSKLPRRHFKVSSHAVGLAVSIGQWTSLIDNNFILFIYLFIY